MNLEAVYDDFALRAAEHFEVQRAVAGAKSRIEAIRAVRQKLGELFPEIKELPERKLATGQVLIGALASHDTLIAKRVVELLWEWNVRGVRKALKS